VIIKANKAITMVKIVKDGPCSVVVVTLYGEIMNEVAEIGIELRNCF